MSEKNFYLDNPDPIIGEDLKEERLKHYKSRDGLYYDTYRDAAEADRRYDEMMDGGFKSSKTGERYSTLQGMLNAEAELDRQEMKRLETKERQRREESERERDWLERKTYKE